MSEGTPPPSQDGQQPPANNGDQQPPNQNQEPQPPDNLDAWLTDQPTEVQGVVKPLIEKATTGYKSALEAERSERRKLEAQIKQISGKLTEGDATRAQLETLSGQLGEANRKADFFQQAGEQGISKPQAMYVLATNDPEGVYLTTDGRNGKMRVDWEALKRDFPEFWPAPAQTPPARSNAGNGTQGQPGQRFDMNTLLRGR
jgi:hypothetical protein